MTRGEAYNEISPESEGNPEGGAHGALLLGNTLGLEGYIGTAIFQYSIVR